MTMEATRAPCPLCGGGDIRSFLRAPDPCDPRGAVYDVVRCEGCGAGITRGGAPSYPASYFAAPRRAFPSPFLPLRLAKIRAVIRAGRVLDYGCGRGGFVEYLRRNGFDALGFDPHLPAEAPDCARDWEAIRARAPFDLVTFWQSLEHLEDPVAALASARDVLAPGGRIFLSLPDFGSAQARAGGAAWFHLDLPRHRRHFDGASLEKTLACAGLQTLRRFRYSLEYDTVGWLGTWWNLLLPRPNAFYLATKGAFRWDFSLFASLATLPILAPAAFVRSLRADGGGVIEVVAGRRGGG